MKNSIIFLLTILMITTALLNAESDEWGAWFKESMENSKKNREQFSPENKGIVQHNWKHTKDELINTYKEFIEKHRGENLTRSDYPENILQILSYYYYDKTDPDIDKTVDFFIYVVENDMDERIKFDALNSITTIALEGNNSARNYIFLNVNNNSLSHRLNLQFHLANITLQEDQQSLNYLMTLIEKAQDVETTKLKFGSSDEGAIIGFLNSGFFSIRYNKDLEYDYALPLVEQMIYSRSKGVQITATFIYYYQTNRTEMRKIYDTCWTKVQDKGTRREEYVNALYGLQALYSLSQRNFGEHKIGFKGISSYFARLGGRKPVENGFEYIELTDENRITKEEKQYFQNRLRSK